MGAGLVKICFDRWSHLGDVPFRVLVYMAVTVLDSDPEPTFWEGRVALAGALGRTLVDPDLTGEDAERQQRRRTLKAVDRAIQLLTVAGAIKLTGRPGPGRNARYRLDLSMERYPLSGDCEAGNGTESVGTVDQAAAADVNGTVPTQWAQRSPLSDATVPTHRGPEEYQEELGVLQQPQQAVATVTVPRARPAEDPNLIGGPATRITLRVLPGTGTQPSPHVVTQPALWPAAVPEVPDVDATQARQMARTAVAKAQARRHPEPAPNVPQEPLGPADGATPPQAPTPPCAQCGTLLDRDGSCFTCRTGPAHAVSA